MNTNTYVRVPGRAAFRPLVAAPMQCIRPTGVNTRFQTPQVYNTYNTGTATWRESTGMPWTHSSVTVQKNCSTFCGTTNQLNVKPANYVQSWNCQSSQARKIMVKSEGTSNRFPVTKQGYPIFREAPIPVATQPPTSQKFLKPFAPLSQPVTPLLVLPSDTSLRCFTVELRRLRGVSTQLHTYCPSPVMFETFGCCIIFSGYFVNLPGFQFILKENGSNERGATITCVYYDMDGITPAVEVGKFYRCVGRYHVKKHVFQCYMIEQCDQDIKQMTEAFLEHSNIEITKVVTEYIESTEPVPRKVFRTHYNPI